MCKISVWMASKIIYLLPINKVSCNVSRPTPSPSWMPPQTSHKSKLFAKVLSFQHQHKYLVSGRADRSFEMWCLICNVAVCVDQICQRYSSVSNGLARRARCLHVHYGESFPCCVRVNKMCQSPHISGYCTMNIDSTHSKKCWLLYGNIG